MCKFELKQHAEQALAPRIDLLAAITARSQHDRTSTGRRITSPAAVQPRPSLLFRRGRPRHCDSLAFRAGLSGFPIPARIAGLLPVVSNVLHELAALLALLCDQLA